MTNIFMQREWNWQLSGFALALAFLLSVVLVKPIGVSTQFVILDGIIWNKVSPGLVVENAENKSGYGSSNAYLNKSSGKYAKNVAKPLNYSFVFVLAMIAGGLVARLLQKEDEPYLYGQSGIADSLDSLSMKRIFRTFIGGLIVLFGARLAGGCTSGHMMSGMMQTSLSGYLFAASAFAAAIPTAIIFYGRED